MSLIRTSPCSSAVILAIALSLTACGNNDDTTSNEMDAAGAADVGAAEEIRGTVLDTTADVVEKATETTMTVAEKAAEVAEEASEATGEAVEDVTEAVSGAVESASDAVEAKLVVPSLTGSDDTSKE